MLATTHRIDQAEVLKKAFLNAGSALGLGASDLAAVIGRDRTTLTRGRLEPGNKTGELALLLIRCYRGLYALVGGDAEQMRHWMHTENRHTGGVPAEQVKSVQGLNAVLLYLDAMRGKN